MNMGYNILMNNTSKQSNTYADLNLCWAAEDIIEIFEKNGFTSDVPPDIELLRNQIIEAIQYRLQNDLIVNLVQQDDGTFSEDIV